MITVFFGGIIGIVLVGSMYWAAAVFLHTRCGLPGRDCFQVSALFAWLFWGNRKDHLRDPLGISLQAGSMIGIALMVIALFTPLESPNRRTLLMAAFVTPFVVAIIMSTVFQLIRKF